MKKRPIIFSAPMVRANHAGRKSMTRRVITLPANARDVTYWTTWGSVPFAGERIHRVLSILRGSAVKCLGTNKDGSPRHPLYVPKNAPLAPWEAV